MMHHKQCGNSLWCHRIHRPWWGCNDKQTTIACDEDNWAVFMIRPPLAASHNAVPLLTDWADFCLLYHHCICSPLLHSTSLFHSWHFLLYASFGFTGMSVFLCSQLKSTTWVWIPVGFRSWHCFTRWKSTTTLEYIPVPLVLLVEY